VSLIYGDYYFLEALLRYQSLVTAVPVGPGGGSRLDLAFPNPFRTSTSIAFRLSTTSQVRLSVYDVRGAEIRTLVRGPRSGGEYHVPWDGAHDDGTPAGSISSG
jgi:hypothetical protein